MRWTLKSAAAEFGTTRETLKRGMRIAGIDEDKTYATMDICRALFGDLKGERIRETRARADLLEMESTRNRRTRWCWRRCRPSCGIVYYRFVNV